MNGSTPLLRPNAGFALPLLDDNAEITTPERAGCNGFIQENRAQMKKKKKKLVTGGERRFRVSPLRKRDKIF